jgi:hypothetical protein
LFFLRRLGNLLSQVLLDSIHGVLFFLLIPLKVFAALDFCNFRWSVVVFQDIWIREAGLAFGFLFSRSD